MAQVEHDGENFHGVRSLPLVRGIFQRSANGSSRMAGERCRAAYMSASKNALALLTSQKSRKPLKAYLGMLCTTTERFLTVPRQAVGRSQKASAEGRSVPSRGEWGEVRECREVAAC